MLSNPCYASQVIQNEDTFFITEVVTFETVTTLQKTVIALILKNPSISHFQIDFSRVTEVNSAALGLLIELKKYIIAHQKTVIFLNLPERLLSLAQVCGVADWLCLR